MITNSADSKISQARGSDIGQQSKKRREKVEE